MRFLTSGFFMNRQYLGPRSTYQNILFSRKYLRKNVFFVPISGFPYPEVVQFPGMVTRRLYNFHVTIPQGSTISRFSNPEVSQPPGNNNRIMLKKTFLEKMKSWQFSFCFVGKFLGIVSWRLYNFQVTISGGCTISGYCNPEVVQLLCYNSRRLHSIRVQLPRH